MFSIWVFCRGCPVRHAAKVYPSRVAAEAALTAMFPVAVSTSPYWTGNAWVALGQFEAFVTEAGSL